MTTFRYAALDTHGRETRGVLEVNDQREALGRIHEMGLFPTDVRRATLAPSHPPPGRGAWHWRERWRERRRPGRSAAWQIRPRALAAFTGELATLVQAGLPLLKGLQVLEQQETNPALKRVIGDVGHLIEGGNTLSEALAAHPGVFNNLYVNMVKAGEVGGVLDVVLERLAGFMDKAIKLKGKVKAAMVYPCAVLVVAGAILVGLLGWVVPQFRRAFEGLTGAQTLPPFTEFVFGLSDVLRHHFAWVGLLGVALAVSAGMALRTPAGRRWVDRFKLAAPVVGTLFRKLAITRFARTFGTLMSSGVPILQTLSIVQQTAGNVIVGEAVAHVQARVKEGETLAEPLQATSVFPPTLISMVAVGEQTGALPDMLLKVSDKYDAEVDNAVAALASLIEPILIVGVAVIVGGIVVALYLPILSLVTDSGFGTNPAAAELGP